MDRRNGGDPLAPPRPPKSLPRVHRPRAPEPTIMSAANSTNQSSANNSANNTTITNRSLHNVQQLSPKPRNLSASSSPARNLSSNILSSIPPPLPPQIAPLTPLHTRSSSNSSSISSSSHHHPHHHQLSTSSIVSNNLAQPASTFSRRRPPAALPTNSTPSILNPSIETTASTTTTTSASSPVTLAAPRPENERLTNEYVDTPFSRLSPASNRQRGQHAIGSAATTGSATTPMPSVASSIDRHHQLSVSQPTNNRLHSPSTIHSSNSTTVSTIGKPIGSTATTTTLHSSNRNFNNNTINSRPNQLPLGQTTSSTAATTTTTTGTTGMPLSGAPTIQSATLPITKQPVSNNFSKDSSAAGLHELDTDLHPSSGDLLNSITCPQCKKCRCEECQRPRQLPSRWLCDKTCLCSAETIIDYASCLCCVKALFYHCSKDHELERESDTVSCADDPCSCVPHKRTTRWGCLAALSLPLPCLLCYWPMRGCVAICAKCYAKHSRHGCRCQSQNGSSLADSILGGTGLGSGSLGGGGNGGSQGGNGNLDHGSNISSKFSTVSSTSPFSKGHHHHHHHSHHNHHHHHSGDLTPEKRLLDSSPEY
ncbi:protein sprouty [Aedes aegypti]|uniref:Sprouty n=1 Tax=Aedes aegypti TaxID=7159 RepID=A0A1S4G215_AEDAE|nr:protein sprouty [Aedes aegypti]XP_021698822.1 protein sprouty [Aedes aegypti]